MTYHPGTTMNVAPHLMTPMTPIGGSTARCTGVDSCIRCTKTTRTVASTAVPDSYRHDRSFACGRCRLSEESGARSTRKRGTIRRMSAESGRQCRRRDRSGARCTVGRRRAVRGSPCTSLSARHRHRRSVLAAAAGSTANRTLIDRCPAAALLRFRQPPTPVHRLQCRPRQPELERPRPALLGVWRSNSGHTMKTTTAKCAAAE